MRMKEDNTCRLLRTIYVYSNMNVSSQLYINLQSSSEGRVQLSCSSSVTSDPTLGKCPFDRKRDLYEGW